jgi:hypothetical protein
MHTICGWTESNAAMSFVARFCHSLFCSFCPGESHDLYIPILHLTSGYVHSIMTLVTLFVHRIRAARHAARQRAPSDVVRALPVRVWTGAGWVCEKDWIASNPHESTPSSSPTPEEPSSEPPSEVAVPQQETEGVPNWFASQGECAICLSSFARGDRVRVLPCSHVFHVDEVDGWLLNRRKVVSLFCQSIIPSLPHSSYLPLFASQCPICKADVTHPAPRTAPHRVFPVAVHPDIEGRTTGPGTGVLHDHGTAESGVGSGSAAPGSSTTEESEWWWQRVWRHVREGRGGEATERTPLLST